MPANYYPDFAHMIPWSADPNDPQAVDVYTDVTAMVRAIDQYPRGAQYELAQARVFASRVTFRDVNEYLNPVNSSSPYYPFVQPYRKLASLATWPKAPGANSNLLNLNNWRVPADGSFESYAVGELPEFITQTSVATGPSVVAALPHSGTQSLTWTVATSATRQGIAFNVACVPGQQYTTSAYVTQTSASTQIIRVSDQVLTGDTFNRTTSSSWGTAAAPLNIGGAWTSGGGFASNRSTTPATPYAAGYATSLIEAVGGIRSQIQPNSARDLRQQLRWRVSAVATGGPIHHRAAVRYADASNYYYAQLSLNTDLTVSLGIYKRVASVVTALTTAYDLDGVYYQVGDEFCMDWQVIGNTLRVAAWRVGSPALDVVTEALLTITDTSLTASGLYGVIYELDAANTNTLPYDARLYSYSAVGGVEGTSTAATGSYQRLSVTFTATQPQHEITVITTQGSAVAGTVNLDGVMHNTGAAAGTFTSTGSTIYPVGRPYIERWPRTYEDAGFLGICEADAVDALAALAALKVPADYDHAVMSLGPDFYYPLSGGSNSTLYPDVTGNNNPPLGLNISKYGIGTLPAGGAAMSIPGGAGATGVTFTPPSTPTGNNLAATVLGTGRLSESPGQPFVVPHSLTGTGGVWAMTVAVWVRGSTNAANMTVFYPSKQAGSSAGQAYIPIYMDAKGGSGTAYQNVDSAGAPHVLTSGVGLSGINLLDGEPHLLVGTVVQVVSTGDTIVYRYIDDVLDGVNNATGASLGGPLRSQTDSLSVGATDDGASFLAVMNGSLSRLAIWNRELTITETAALWRAAQGFTGELSTERLERHFDSGGFYGPRRIDDAYTFASVMPGDPVTTMQAPSWTGSIDGLTDAQNTMTAEGGHMWAAADGYVTATGRASRYLTLEPKWTLGEDTAAGEIPYAGSIGFDFDPTFVFGDVTVTRANGVEAVGGLAPDIVAAKRRYFPRNYGMSGDFETDQQAQDAADFIFYSHRAPNMRVESISVNPVADPTLWHFALSVEVGDRVRVKRRAKAANAAAGLTMSADYFVEQVVPRDIHFGRGTYTVELQLSPIGTGPGPTMQPWILEDTTLSVLDSTTVLGW